MMKLVFNVNLKHIILLFKGKYEQLFFVLVSEYVPNKRAGRKNVQILINVLFLIRACWMENSLKNK